MGTITYGRTSATISIRLRGRQSYQPFWRTQLVARPAAERSGYFLLRMPPNTASDHAASESSMKVPQTGGCQCGRLRYEITQAPCMIYTCHRTNC